MVAPLAVVAQFGLAGIQHLVGLIAIGFGVHLDLLGSQRRARGVAARRVADQRGEVADQEDHRMAQVLQLAHLVENNRMPNVDIRCRRVQPQLDTQRHASRLRARQLLGPILLGQELIDSAQRDFKRLSDTVGDRVCCNSRMIHKGFSGCLVSSGSYTSELRCGEGF
ncbi:hypothetical protein SDC9_151200 [bioreactor metagenome]|uniref:Uncharacterized protein n=1 Tax=bioreactor metagenome TaxID=1076179 RepID=A0A645EPL8_9ZZZZ